MKKIIGIDLVIKERDATKLAGEMAGLNVLQIVNKPTAGFRYLRLKSRF
ncbi:MAG: Hsp70 family protein [Planctomycetaceae bacterium]|nr:Hsp70 family protein [Planctomycetaceae bacterium]